MTDDDKETYLYLMRYADYLFKKNGKSALDDLEAYEIEKMRKIWDDLGERHGRSLSMLMDLLWGAMGADFRYELTKIGDDEVSIRCTKCPFAELAIDNGMKEVGFSKYCMSDYGIVAGFNGRIEFGRTKTLMEGDDCCDHHYKLPK